MINAMTDFDIAKDKSPLGVLVVPEYLNNILVAYSHIKRACTGGKFELNGLLVW